MNEEIESSGVPESVSQGIFSYKGEISRGVKEILCKPLTSDH